MLGVFLRKKKQDFELNGISEETTITTNHPLQFHGATANHYGVADDPLKRIYMLRLQYEKHSKLVYMSFTCQSSQLNFTLQCHYTSQSYQTDPHFYMASYGIAIY